MVQGISLILFSIQVSSKKNHDAYLLPLFQQPLKFHFRPETSDSMAGRMLSPPHPILAMCAIFVTAPLLTTLQSTLNSLLLHTATCFFVYFAYVGHLLLR